jgi:hypothetical protein
LHGKLQVDDVLVVGQHQRFFQHLALDVVAVTDFNGAHLIDVDHLARLDRPRQMPARSRLGGLGIFAEAQHHAALAGVDNVKPARHPHQHQHTDQQADQVSAARQTARRQAITAAPFAAEQAVEALVDPTPYLIQVRRPTGFVAVIFVAPLRVVPGHIVR